jgi:hypothetical protein
MTGSRFPGNLLFSFTGNSPKISRNPRSREMTPEARLDRLEEVFANLVGRIDSLIKLQKDNEVRFARLVESQINTDRRVEALVEIVREGLNSKSRRRK